MIKHKKITTNLKVIILILFYEWEDVRIWDS